MAEILYGKHPAFGDFVSYGLARGIVTALDAWIEEILPPLKSMLGEYWKTTWRSAPALHFWIGPSIFGTPMIGVWVPSEDKVGRLYPLIAGYVGVATPPPTHPTHDETPFIALDAHIQNLAKQAQVENVSALVEGLSSTQPAGTPWQDGQDGTLWGERADGDMARLLQDARQADTDKAQLLRSHWWHGDLPNRHTGWLGINGLPDAAAMHWLLTARARPTPMQTSHYQDHAEAESD